MKRRDFLLAVLGTCAAARFASAEAPRRIDCGGHVRCVAFSPDGKELAVGREVEETEKRLTLWNVSSGRRIASLGGHQSRVRAVAYSPDGKTLVSGDDVWILRFWDAATHRLLSEMDVHECGGIDSIAFSLHGKRMVSGASREVRLWDTERRKVTTVFEQDPPLRGYTAISPDGYLVAAGGEEDVYVWDSRTFKQVATLKGHSRPIDSLAFTSDGDELVTASYDHSVRFWRRRDFSSRLVMKGVGSQIALSPDGKALAIWGSGPGTIKLYDMKGTRLREFTLENKEEVAYDAVFSPNGDQIALVTDYGVLLWRLNRSDK